MAEFEYHQLGIQDTSIPSTLVNGHYFLLKNPMDHFSFLEPATKCGNGPSFVLDTVKGIFINEFINLKINVLLRQMEDFL